MSNRALALLPVALLAVSAAARGQEAEINEIEHWIPSFGLSIGAIRQSASAIQQSSQRPSDDEIPPPGPFPGTPSAGDESLVDPLSVFTAELMTPGLGFIPTQPRLFVHGEIGGAFGSSVHLAEEGTPGEFNSPLNVPALGVATTPARAVGGQGTLTDVEISTLIGGAGAGIAFSTDVRGRRLRFKPSFEYLMHGVEVTGVVQHASGQRRVDSTGTVLENFVLTSFNEQRERTLHSVGGGFEIEMDTMRAGPFVIALFANGQAYRLLGDTDIRLFATDGTNTASWHVTMDREIYRGSVGLRFRFFPED